MYCNEHEPLALLVELTPKLAKKKFRESIYQAWDYKCGYCGDAATSLDHIVPRFKSGSSNRHNLLPCCRRCNALKGSEDMKSWYTKQPYFSIETFDRIETWTKQQSTFIFGDK
jgi:5-methylcytosine-specific restriction endonuclease McrA